MVMASSICFFMPHCAEEKPLFSIQNLKTSFYSIKKIFSKFCSKDSSTSVNPISETINNQSSESSSTQILNKSNSIIESTI
jgi:hypothetical protein